MNFVIYPPLVTIRTSTGVLTSFRRCYSDKLIWNEAPAQVESMDTSAIDDDGEVGANDSDLEAMYECMVYFNKFVTSVEVSSCLAR